VPCPVTAQRAGPRGDSPEVVILEFIHAAAALVGVLHAWYLDQPLPVQVVVWVVALAVLWVAWLVLRLTLGVLRGAFRGL
jgi:hypothetical protein